MGFRIMNRKLNAYSLEGMSCINYYEQNKEYHINPKYVSYGDVLVQTKRVVCGFSLKLKFFFRNHWYWKPHYYWKYDIHYFHWLFFMIWIDKEYKDVFDKVIKDHLSEAQSA